MAASPTSPALSLEGVVRVHGAGSTAVRALGPVSLEVAAGEFVAVMGPSGAGKSTLLLLAGTLDRPTEGRVRVFGRDLALLSHRELAALRRRTVGYVFQELNLLPGLTALENAALPLELDGVPVPAARRAAQDALDSLDVGALGHRFPAELSGGEQQRVALARAFVGTRSLLLADEPTGALDSISGELVMRALRSRCDAGHSVVLVTHDASHAAWADRIVHLRDGVLAPRATADGRAPGGRG